jgi:16S rRNA (adenine1518-N6/adenine1519-N6)-dimethyltransferase
VGLPILVVESESQYVSVTPKKSLGQHFLTDPNIRDKIVDALQATQEDCVVEIGPGTGAMTGILSARYPRFEAVEIDQRAIAYLQDQLPGLIVHQANVVRYAWKDHARRAGQKLHVIGNLPYYVTSQVLFDLMDAHTTVAEAVLMMQREVADRLVARPRTKAYGVLSVLIQRYTRPVLLFKVSRHVFFPKPDVESAVVRLEFIQDIEGPDLSTDAYRQVVKTAFNQRRKTLRNSLKSLAATTGRPVPEIWSGKRAEELTPSEFIDLARHFFTHPGG